MEVESRLQESQQRKMELDDEKSRKSSEVTALQAAASTRREKANSEKLERLAKKDAEGIHRVEEMEREREIKKVKSIEKQLEVKTRAMEIQFKKIE